MAQRVPLCEPGTFNTVLAYAGKQAIVVSAKPLEVSPFSQSVLARMAPEARAIIEDQQKAVTLLVEFDDSKKLDTCAAIGPARMSEYFELADGERLAALPQPTATTPLIQMQAMEALSETEVESAGGEAAGTTTCKSTMRD